MEFAKESQEALCSIPTISTSLASLFLLLISPHQHRFKVKESSVFVVIMIQKTCCYNISQIAARNLSASVCIHT